MIKAISPSGFIIEFPNGDSVRASDTYVRILNAQQKPIGVVPQPWALIIEEGEGVPYQWPRPL